MTDTNCQTEGLPLVNSNRTPEEELQYRVKNRLRLRDGPMTREERREVIDEIADRDYALLRRLADA